MRTRGGGRAVAAVGPRTDGARSLDSQIEQDGGGDDGYPEGAHRVSDAGFFEKAHRPVGRREPERTPPGKHHRVDPLHGVFGVEQVGLTGPGSGAPDVHPRDRALAGEDYGAAGGQAIELMLADLDAGHRNESGILGKRNTGLAFRRPRTSPVSENDPESEEQQRNRGSAREQNGLDSMRRSRGRDGPLRFGRAARSAPPGGRPPGRD